MFRFRIQKIEKKNASLCFQYLHEMNNRSFFSIPFQIDCYEIEMKSTWILQHSHSHRFVHSFKSHYIVLAFIDALRVTFWFNYSGFSLHRQKPRIFFLSPRRFFLILPFPECISNYLSIFFQFICNLFVDAAAFCKVLCYIRWVVWLVHSLFSFSLLHSLCLSLSILASLTKCIQTAW